MLEDVPTEVVADLVTDIIIRFSGKVWPYARPYCAAGCRRLLSPLAILWRDFKTWPLWLKIAFVALPASFAGSLLTGMVMGDNAPFAVVAYGAVMGSLAVVVAMLLYTFTAGRWVVSKVLK